MHEQMSCKYFVLEVPFTNNTVFRNFNKKKFFNFSKNIATFEKSIKMLKNYSYNHIYISVQSIFHIESKEIYA